MNLRASTSGLLHLIYNPAPGLQTRLSFVLFTLLVAVGAAFVMTVMRVLRIV